MSNLNVCACGCGRFASDLCGTAEYLITLGWVEKDGNYSPPEKEICEEVLTDCTQSCKEMGWMSEGCDYCR